MFKRVALVLATVLAGFLGAVVIAAPAQAVPTCQAGLICWFDQNNWQGTKYSVATGGLNQGQCYNMGLDPNTGINWNNIIDSVWWNGVVVVGVTHAVFYENTGCSGTLITQPYADGHADNQMHSCIEPATEWNGPCGPPSNVVKRISSWAFWY